MHHRRGAGNTHRRRRTLIMDPDLPDLTIADVVLSTAGRDAGNLFYVLEADEIWLTLVNGKDRTIEKPKRKKS